MNEWMMNENYLEALFIISQFFIMCNFLSFLSFRSVRLIRIHFLIVLMYFEIINYWNWNWISKNLTVSGCNVCSNAGSYKKLVVVLPSNIIEQICWDSFRRISHESPPPPLILTFSIFFQVFLHFFRWRKYGVS